MHLDDTMHVSAELAVLAVAAVASALLAAVGADDLAGLAVDDLEHLHLHGWLRGAALGMNTKLANRKIQAL